MDWTFSENPQQKGWYAISYCWEAEEGIFNGASFWTGTNWEGCLPIFAFAGPFETSAEAVAWADAQDVEK